MSRIHDEPRRGTSRHRLLLPEQPFCLLSPSFPAERRRARSSTPTLAYYGLAGKMITCARRLLPQFLLLIASDEFSRECGRAASVALISSICTHALECATRSPAASATTIDHDCDPRVVYVCCRARCSCNSRAGVLFCDQSRVRPPIPHQNRARRRSSLSVLSLVSICVKQIAARRSFNGSTVRPPPPLLLLLLLASLLINSGRG